MTSHNTETGFTPPEQAEASGGKAGAGMLRREFIRRLGLVTLATGATLTGVPRVVEAANEWLEAKMESARDARAQIGFDQLINLEDDLFYGPCARAIPHLLVLRGIHQGEGVGKPSRRADIIYDGNDERYATFFEGQVGFLRNNIRGANKTLVQSGMDQMEDTTVQTFRDYENALHQTDNIPLKENRQSERLRIISAHFNRAQSELEAVDVQAKEMNKYREEGKRIAVEGHVSGGQWAAAWWGDQKLQEAGCEERFLAKKKQEVEAFLNARISTLTNSIEAQAAAGVAVMESDKHQEHYWSSLKNMLALSGTYRYSEQDAETFLQKLDQIYYKSLLRDYESSGVENPEGGKYRKFSADFINCLHYKPSSK